MKMAKNTRRWTDKASFDLFMAVLAMRTGLPPLMAWALWSRAVSLEIALRQMYVIEEDK